LISELNKSHNNLVEEITEELFEIHNKIEFLVENKIKGFKSIWLDGSDVELFIELSFCILTPQSKAIEAWKAICNLVESKDLFKGNSNRISKELNRVRFKNNKAKYLLNARVMFSGPQGFLIRELLNNAGDIFEKRKWLAENVIGIGYKEASHFLRNIGFVEDLAILDRHILKNMKHFGLIPEIPKSITPRIYIDLENKMKEFSSQINIPLGYLDFIFWYKETGVIFK